MPAYETYRAQGHQDNRSQRDVGWITGVGIYESHRLHGVLSTTHQRAFKPLPFVGKNNCKTTRNDSIFFLYTVWQAFLWFPQIARHARLHHTSAFIRITWWLARAMAVGVHFQVTRVVMLLQLRLVLRLIMMLTLSIVRKTTSTHFCGTKGKQQVNKRMRKKQSHAGWLWLPKLLSHLSDRFLAIAPGPVDDMVYMVCTLTQCFRNVVWYWTSIPNHCNFKFRVWSWKSQWDGKA